MNNQITKKSQAYLLGLISLCTIFSAYAKVQEVISAAEYEGLIKNGKPVVVKYYATWCPHCKAAKEPYEDLSEDAKFAGVTFLAVDIDKNKGLADGNNVAGVPTFIFYNNGQKVGSPIVGIDNMDKFESIIGNAIHSRLGISTSIETPQEAEVKEHKEATPAQHPAAPEQEPAKGGVVEGIKALVMGIVNFIMSIIMGIVNFIKGLFGK